MTGVYSRDMVVTVDESLRCPEPREGFTPLTSDEMWLKIAVWYIFAPLKRLYTELEIVTFHTEACESGGIESPTESRRDRALRL